MKTDTISKKNINLPLQRGPKRAISQVKEKETRIETCQFDENYLATPTSVANRLVQKRISIDRKIESMRKQKLEAEMKEVQSKPKISVRSRQIALKAEKKFLGANERIQLLEDREAKPKIKSASVEKKNLVVNYELQQKLIDYEKFTFGVDSSKFTDEKFLFKSNLSQRNCKNLESDAFTAYTSEKHARNISGDDIDEIEEDIKLLEKCLNIDANKVKSPDYEIKRSNTEIRSPVAVLNNFRFKSSEKISNHKLKAKFIHKTGHRHANMTPDNLKSSNLSSKRDINKNNFDRNKSSPDATKITGDINKTGSDTTKATGDINKTNSDVNKTAGDINKTTSDTNKTAGEINKSGSDVYKMTGGINKGNEDSNKNSNRIPFRKFIKKDLKANKKCCSMETFSQFKFNYRSLSPYHIQITRHNEN